MSATPYERYRVVPASAEPDAPVVDLWGLADCTDADSRVTGPDGGPMLFRFFGDAARWADEHSEKWRPNEGTCAFDTRSGQQVRVMAVHACGVFVRRLRDGRESVTTLRELSLPEHAAEER
ncbi:hypothetical protein [Kitasatospora sp. NPDC088134]|uniref:hypothetical protein n=1 Tax=Kitasatospora sp. NPDC088134 TaxID=3364071 RepID=UPI003808A376